MILWYLSLFSLWFSPILCFYAAFLRQSCYLIALMSAMLGHFSALFLLSVLCHYLQFGFELSDQVRAGTVPVWGRGTVEYVLCRGGGLPAAWKRMMTLLRHCPWLWLVVLIHERWILASDWMQWWPLGGATVGLFTADLYRILLSDHYDNFSKYNKQMLQT